MSWLKDLFGRKDADKPETSAPKQSISLRQGSPEFDEFIARGTLETGDELPHGAQHLANLVDVDPANPEWRALIDRYVAAAGPAIDALLPETEKRYTATEALRAYLWQVQGRLADAVLRLVEVTDALRDLRYLDGWALDWLEAEGAIEKLPEQTALRLFSLLLVLTPEGRYASARRLRLTGRWAALLERAAPRYTPSGLLTLQRAGLLRKADRLDAALAVTGPIEAAESFNHAAAIGLVLRRKGLFLESARAFARGIEIEPQNEAGYLEAGDSCFDATDWLAARGWYEGALRVEPGQVWAEPSILYCDWKLTGDGACFDRMVESAKAGNRRAHQLWFLERGALAEPQDATANALRQMREAWAKSSPRAAQDGEKVEIGLSSIEAPSNRLAIALEFAAAGRDLTIQISAPAPVGPDPRAPVAEIAHRIWRYDGTDAGPALPPPSAETAARIAALAAEPYDPPVNWAQASFAAEALGVGRVEEILAVMVHPPALPPGQHALAWLPRIQLVAAQVLGQLDAGWEESIRRKALLSLLHGPFDWTTTAAIRVLAWIAREERATALDIHKSFELLEQHRPEQGYWGWVEQLYQEWPSLPFLFDQEREELRRKAEELRRQD